MKQNLRQFLSHVRIGYLLFTSLLILGFVYGSFEIIKIIFWDELSNYSLQVLYFSRGIIVSLLLMIWAAWTVYNYRELYEKKIETTEGYYRDIITHSGDAIIALDEDSTIISWNRGAEEILGWESEEMIGESVKKIIPQQLLANGELEHIQEGIYTSEYITNYETERLHKNGETVLVSLTESLIRNENDKIIGRSKILRDLTKLKIREEQIQHSERLATLGHMAAGVAHEVGNPLTAISSLVQVCQRKTDEPFIQDQLSKVREHIQRITKIVRDLVDFSRPSSLEVETMNINQIIKSSVGLLQHDARCRDVQFNMQLSSEIPSLEGVPDHIHQVLVNILLNAVDAMEEEKSPTIAIKSWSENNTVKISITDVGIGIPYEEQSRIFEPFFTTKEVGSGTGLGLSVSHGIITQMDGNIEVVSEPKVGTTFIITLPVTKTG